MEILKKSKELTTEEMYYLTMSPETQKMSDNIGQIVDIEDFENLKMLNKMKLSKYPLNLKFLCDNPLEPVNLKVNQWHKQEERI